MLPDPGADRVAGPGELVASAMGGASERWTWSEALAVNESKTIVDLSRYPQDQDFVLNIRSVGGTATVNVQQFYERSRKPMVFHVPADGGVQLRASGGMTIIATAGATNAIVVDVAILRRGGHVEPLPPFEAHATLVQGGGGAAGAWTALGAVSGSPPEDRFALTLYSGRGPVEVRFVNDTGAVFVDGITVNGGPLELYHPPLLTLQVRHPGADATAHPCVAVWRRADR